MFKKPKKQIKKIKVTIVKEHEHNNDSFVFDIREFEIPAGGSYKIETIGGNFNIYDNENNLIKKINWQAGYTQEYEFIYEEASSEKQS
jgi:penicillin V acylase-like amidase (Ntn superfamily)